MVVLKFLFACVVALGLSNCQKKSDAAEKEIGEAGYSMSSDGWFSAVRSNDVSVMRKMVDGGFDAKTVDSEGNSALHVAAATGNREATEYLLNHGFPVDALGTQGRTSLMASVMADKPAMVKWLLRQGADPKLKDQSGFMALMLAVTEGRKECVEELAPYHREDLDSALLLASLIGKAEVIDTLTNYGASVYARMEDGRTVLMLAAQKGHREAAELLIDIGASRFATLENGDTAQSLAVAAGHTELAALIEKGFSGDSLALETDEEVADAMNEYLNEFQNEPAADVGELAANEDADSKKPRKKLLPNQAASSQTKTAATIEGARMGRRESSSAQNAQKEETKDDLPLVMRHYRQRELPVEVKRISGNTAILHIAGSPAKLVKVKAGENISGSNLSVIRVFSRTEQGKLNDGAPMQIGIVEVVDSRSGRKMQWTEGRPAVGHDPVALVEDAATGMRYVAKPGQKFTSEDGREFIVNDVRPGQVVIEETASGEVRTLRLRGAKG